MPVSKRFGSIEAIGEKTDNKCHICHEEAHPEDYGSPAGPLGRFATTVDHLIPQAHGGTDDFDNLALAHAGCNSSRGTVPPEIARLIRAGTVDAPLSTAEVAALARVERARATGMAAVLTAVAVGTLGLFGALFFFGRKKKKAAKARAERLATMNVEAERLAAKMAATNAATLLAKPEETAASLSGPTTSPEAEPDKANLEQPDIDPSPLPVTTEVKFTSPSPPTADYDTWRDLVLKAFPRVRVEVDS